MKVMYVYSLTKVNKCGIIRIWKEVIFLKVHTDHPEYKTARQWAKLGKLPKRNARKLTMWANHWCATQHDFFAPDKELTKWKRLTKLLCTT